MTLSRKKTIYFFVLFIVAAALAWGISFGLQYAYIGSSYASKTVCSCRFVSGRDFDNIMKEDLYAVSYANVEIDEKQKVVTANIYGIAETKAVFREGFGCTLVNEVSEEELKNQTFAYHRSQNKFKFSKGKVTEYFDSIKLSNVVDNIFKNDSLKPLQTRAVVILKDGKLIFEKYGPGISANTPLIGWSMTKSVTNAMVGLLVNDKKLDIYKPVPLAEWQTDERKNITLDQLLRMSSGLGFEENYAKPSDATTMLFKARSAGNYALKARLTYKPGEVFQYSSGTTNIIQEVIRRQFNSLEEYQRFPHERLFDKIGMASAVLEPDASGTYIGSSFMYATALDWAKFGQLYLQDGVWKGERVLPTGWAAYSATESPNSKGIYAAHFWIDHTNEEFPHDAYFADGFEGQFVTIIPSEDMVVVRLGCTYGQKFNNVDFIINLLKAKKTAIIPSTN